MLGLSYKFLLFYFGLGAIASALELWRPNRKLNYWAWDALVFDVFAWFFYQYFVNHWSGVLRDLIPIYFKPSSMIVATPLWVRVIVYYLVGDLSSYWVHRLIHTKYGWRIHHFHHSTTQMYWLSGVRSTVFQQTAYNLPYILWAPLVFDAPGAVFTALMFTGILTNHFMHMNFSWRSNWLEWVIVTPRTHLIHHSSAPEHYNANFGVVFSFWDRLFGTYVDPDTTTVPGVGAGEIKNPLQAAWLMTGVLSAEPNDFLRRNLRRFVPFI